MKKKPVHYYNVRDLIACNPNILEAQCTTCMERVTCKNCLKMIKSWQKAFNKPYFKQKRIEHDS